MCPSAPHLWRIGQSEYDSYEQLSRVFKGPVHRTRVVPHVPLHFTPSLGRAHTAIVNHCS
jgi:hypothetical protein